MSTPKPIKTEGRICFGIAWFDNEEDAATYHKHVRSTGHTYNGGYFHGMPCGRESRFDYFDKELNKQLYAVTMI